MDPSSFKDFFRELLGPLYTLVRDYAYGPLWGAISALWFPSENLFWGYLVSSVFIAFIIYTYGRKEKWSFANFLRFCAPRKVYANKSAIVDCKFYLVNSFVQKIVYGSAILGALGSAQLLSENFESLMEMIFGASLQWKPTVTSRILYSALALMAHDLGVFLGHYLQHKIPILWEFHKVHHSAGVLTPLTNYRTHPLDKVLEMFFVSVFSGILLAVFGYLYAGEVKEYLFLNVGVILFVYLLISNLRHSHIWISYGWRLSHILSSPAMHQIHHSSAERHFDKNYALVFSFWDYFAGSLYIPKRREELSWGLSNQEHYSYDSVWRLYMLPFKNIFSSLMRRQSKASMVLGESGDNLGKE